MVAVMFSRMRPAAWTPFLIVLFLAAPAPAAEVPPDLERHWKELTSRDETRAALAVLALSRTPEATVAFLERTLHPVKADPKRVARLIAELDGDTFTGRQKAREELEYLGKYIKDDLKKALEKVKGAEAKRHLEELLARMPKPPKKPEKRPAMRPGRGFRVQITTIGGKQTVLINGVPVDLDPPPPVIVRGGPPLLWLRAARAVAVLEHVGTDRARKVLEALASGEPDALPTKRAREALARMNGKKGP
jgi:hypothetical protein